MRHGQVGGNHPTPAKGFRFLPCPVRTGNSGTAARCMSKKTPKQYQQSLFKKPKTSDPWRTGTEESCGLNEAGFWRLDHHDQNNTKRNDSVLPSRLGRSPQKVSRILPRYGIHSGTADPEVDTPSPSCVDLQSVGGVCRVFEYLGGIWIPSVAWAPCYSGPLRGPVDSQDGQGPENAPFQSPRGVARESGRIAFSAGCKRSHNQMSAESP